MNTIKTVGVIALIVLAYGIVGQMDYEDAIKEEQRYCDMVRDGHIELRQMAAFAPLYVRRRETAPKADNEVAS